MSLANYSTRGHLGHLNDQPNGVQPWGYMAANTLSGGVHQTIGSFMSTIT